MQKLMEAAAKVAALDPEARAELVRFLRAKARENRASAPVWPDRPSESDQAFEHMAIAELAIADLVEVAVAVRCGRCGGRGTVDPECPFCADSTHDHECPGPVPCPVCRRPE